MGVTLLGRSECASLSHRLPVAPASPQEVRALAQVRGSGRPWAMPTPVPSLEVNYLCPSGPR